MAKEWADDAYKCMVLNQSCFVVGFHTEFDKIAKELRDVLRNPRVPDRDGRLYPMGCCEVRFSDLRSSDSEHHARRLLFELEDNEVLIVILDESFSGGWSYTFFKSLADEFLRQSGLPLPNGAYLSLPQSRPRATIVVTSPEVVGNLKPEDRNALFEHYSVIQIQDRLVKVSNEAIEKFSERMDACMKRIGGGKVVTDSVAIRALVHQEPETAARVAEIYCLMAQSNPAYFQGALLLATAYYIEFNNPSLMQMVYEQAKAAGAEDWLRQIGVSREMPTPGQEASERIAAKEWWKRTGRQDGLCDNCARPMMRGEGYLVRGPVYVIETPDGPRSIDMGEEIICEECFRKTQGGKGWQ